MPFGVMIGGLLIAASQKPMHGAANQVSKSRISFARHHSPSGNGAKLAIKLKCAIATTGKNGLAESDVRTRKSTSLFALSVM
jgi:hypothetical protein